MRSGMFFMPCHPPERDPYEGIQQDLEEMEWLDELGYSEAWVGEHLTAPWEPYPAGDLIIAQALARTKNIKICSGGYIPTFYHPAALALRAAQLDHMAQGRYMCGIAIGGQPPDWALLGVDGAAGEHRERAFEAVTIMKKMWTEHVGQKWTFEGRFWTVQNGLEFGGLRAHVTPFQKPHPPLAMAGMSPSSSSLRWAGANRLLPLSVLFNAEVLKSHWAVYSEAAEGAGLTADRDEWRVQREVFVAETDEEARDYVRNSNQARLWNEYYFPLFKQFQWLGHIKHDQAVPDDAVDLEYLLENLWLVGSPETVATKLAALSDEVGGFGTVLSTKYDWGTLDDSRAGVEAYRRNLTLMSTEVIPAVTKMTSGSVPS